MFSGFSGAHYFYLGRLRRGVLHLLLLWTLVRMLLGVRDAVRMTLAGREKFDALYPEITRWPQPAIAHETSIPFRTG